MILDIETSLRVADALTIQVIYCVIALVKIDGLFYQSLWVGAGQWELIHFVRHGEISPEWLHLHLPWRGDEGIAF